jgi:CBS domain-containing protein
MSGAVGFVFLSAVLGARVTAESGEYLGRLTDLAVTPGERFPLVTHIVITRRGRVRSLPWAAVSLFRRELILAKDATALREVPAGTEELLLRRDLLDKQIVDVDGARVLRVNDLKLGQTASSLVLRAADVGLRGMLRRLGFLRPVERVAAWTGKAVPGAEIGWEYVQPLDGRLHRLALTMTRDRLSEMHPADLAEIIAQLPHRTIPAVIGALDPETAGEAIGELEPEVGGMVLSQLKAEHASDILDEMEPDEAADLLAEVDETRANHLLTLMDTEEAEKVRELLEHEEDSAGGLMNNEFLALTRDMTAEQALRQVRATAEDVESIAYGYVLDAEGRPLGVLSLRELLLAEPGAPVAELMSENVKSVDVAAEPEDIYELIVKYRLAALPVLDAEGRMEGIVTADDVMQHFLPFTLRLKQYRASRRF